MCQLHLKFLHPVADRQNKRVSMKLTLKFFPLVFSLPIFPEESRYIRISGSFTANFTGIQHLFYIRIELVELPKKFGRRSLGGKKNISVEKNIRSLRGSFITCPQPMASCTCLKRRTSQAERMSGSQQQNIERKRSSSLSWRRAVDSSSRPNDYYSRVWDNLLSRAVRDIYNIETRRNVKSLEC